MTWENEFITVLNVFKVTKKTEERCHLIGVYHVVADTEHIQHISSS